MTTALTATVLWRRRFDKVLRDPNKWDWNWSGGAGIMLGLVLVMTMAHHNVDLTGVISVNMKPIHLILGCMIATLLFQSSGYILAWLLWWLVRMWV